MVHYSALEKLGVFFMCVLFYHIVKSTFLIVYTWFIGPAITKVDFKARGKWALITGSTDGIGKQYARELAARGCDIILVSRTMEKLRAVALEIESDYRVATKVIQADFTAGEEIYDHIAKEISDLEIGTLVNNVGVSYTYPEYFLDVPDWENTMATLIKANVVSMTRMSGLVMPGMVKRGKGVVINIGSTSSIIPSPLLTVYAASKAYVDKFTEGLNMEYTKKGLIIQAVLPGLVCSNMSGVRRSTLFAPSARTFVKSAISLVGTSAKTTGYFPHAVLSNTLNLLQSNNSGFGAWIVTRHMENTRRRALKKYKNQ